jgi:TetR/AcrR family transcriptional regulator
VSPTFVEQARRRQIVEGTIDLVAAEGLAAASLSAIAKRVGLSKAAVLYHFSSKDEVLAETVAHVLGALVAEVGGAVDAAHPDPRAMLLAYVRGFRTHLRAHRTHVRLLVEAGAAAPNDPSRWQNVAAIIGAGQESGTFGEGDTRTLAVLVNGALDGLVGEWLRDETYDLDAAGELLDTAVLRILGSV